MNDQTNDTTKEQADIQASDPVAVACGIARGECQADPNARAVRIRGGHKDLNAKGRGPWWFRMAYRSGSWTYFSDERLSAGTFLASDRRQTVHGDVFPGELICQHDRGGPVDAMYLIVEDEKPKDALVSVEFRKRRDGMLVVTLPDGSEVIVSNPRSR